MYICTCIVSTSARQVSTTVPTPGTPPSTRKRTISSSIRIGSLHRIYTIGIGIPQHIPGVCSSVIAEYGSTESVSGTLMRVSTTMVAMASLHLLVT
jgi:hypothetical protein